VKNIEIVIPLSTRDPHHPIVTIIIKNPFEYVVTLKAFIGNKSKDIRRWDNVRKKDHMDIFFLNEKANKHQKTPIKDIRKLGDLKRLLAYIDRNYIKFIEDYKR
jgi:hypothetical protein